VVQKILGHRVSCDEVHDPVGHIETFLGVREEQHVELRIIRFALRCTSKDRSCAHAYKHGIYLRSQRSARVSDLAARLAAGLRPRRYWQPVRCRARKRKEQVAAEFFVGRISKSMMLK
jgi:hypothetical protein